MIKRIVCLLWGHRPWRTVQATKKLSLNSSVIQLPPIATVGSGHVIAVMDSDHNAATAAAQASPRRGGEVVTLTCDRCAKIVTLEH